MSKSSKKSARAQKSVEAQVETATQEETGEAILTVIASGSDAAPEIVAALVGAGLEIAPEAPKPTTLPVLAPILKGKAAPHMQEVRRLLTGEGGTVAQLCQALGLGDKDARQVIDAIRQKEGKGSVINVYSEKAGRKVFVYRGADGKGLPQAS